MAKVTHFFGDMVTVNGYLWFTEWSMNALFKMNLKTKKTEFVTSFPNETNAGKHFGDMVRCGNKIVFCPRMAKEIAIYDIALNSIAKIRVDFDKYSWRIAAMYGGYAYGKYVYLFRRGYSILYQVDTLSGELSALDIVETETCLEAGDCFWHWRVQHYKDEGNLILYDRIHYILYQYNVNSMKAEKLFCFSNSCQLVDFVSDEKLIWVLCSNGEIRKLENGRVVDKYQCSVNVVDNFALYQCRNVVYVIDMDTGRIILTLGESESASENIVIPVNNTEVAELYTVENKIVIQWKDGSFYYRDSINEVSGFLQSDLKDIPVEAFFPNDIIREDVSYPFERILKVLEFQNDGWKKTVLDDAGKKIYNNIILTD